MKTVRLPIYDENGMQKREYLEVSLDFFDCLMGNLRIWPGSVRIVMPPLDEATKKLVEAFQAQEEADRKAAAEEIEAVDRIISGLPSTTRDKARQYHEREMPRVREERAPHHDWRKIPGFARYTMNPTRKIIEDATDLEVPVCLGRLNNVLISNDDGFLKRMSVNSLFEKTFPELNL